MRKWDGVWVRFVILSGPLEGEGVGEKKKENLMGKKPKTVTRRKFVAQTAGAVVSLGAAGALNVAANSYSSLLSHYLGGRPTTVVQSEGSESWDSTYYAAAYRGRNQAKEAATEVVAQIVEEGAVLLKNDNGALPLAAGTTVSLLGRYAADPVYGGAGSGTVDPNDCVTLYQGIANAGLTINDTAFDFINSNYSNYPKAAITMDDPSTAAYYIGEIPWSAYSSDAQSSISGTTAVIVLGRGGGEGGDLSRDLKGDVESGVSTAFTENDETANYVDGQHELELTVEEKDLIAAAKSACKKVIVLINASTTMELGPLMSGDYEVDAILHIGSLGAAGSNGVGQLLVGAMSPSGKTTDTWVADFTADPTFKNFGGKHYADVSGYYDSNPNGFRADGTAYFVEYKEGIYYGYRYYETAAVEAAAGNYPGFDYDSAVVFPFGYGLSYTTFEQTLDSVSADDTDVKASVTVTNTGSASGKQVVEIYFTAPYKEGGLPKSAVVLGGFAKTSELAAGASETVEVSFPVRRMASWDSDKSGYVLDSGDYDISLRTDSHTVVDSKPVTVAAKTYTTDEVTDTKLTNLFDDCTQYMEKNCTAFSRDDFKGTFPEAAEDTTTDAVGISVAEFAYAQDSSVAMPTTGASNGLSLIDLRGVDYDDELWDSLLDQISVSEMIAVINDAAYNTAEVASISKPATSDPDGPAGFTSLTGSTGNCAYCSEYLMAQTWNVDLIEQVGQAVGEEALSSGYNGWYAPACDTHRSPFAGRNFEYFSEDPVLGGSICAAEIQGAASRGCYGYVKHFALNDQESYRIQHIMIWATEQTMRECYLRQFEIAIKTPSVDMKYISDDKGTMSTKTMPGCTAVMSSFNYIGTEWAGGRKSLLTNLLRDEWGFRGAVITDFNLYGYMEKDPSLLAGNDLQLTYSAMSGDIANTDKADIVAAMRTAMHNVCYTVVNSNAMNGLVPGSSVKYGVAPWQYGVWGGTAVLVALGAFLGYKAVKTNKALKEKKADAADSAEEKAGEKD